MSVLTFYTLVCRWCGSVRTYQGSDRLTLTVQHTCTNIGTGSWHVEVPHD